MSGIFIGSRIVYKILQCTHDCYIGGIIVYMVICQIFGWIGWQKGGQVVEECYKGLILCFKKENGCIFW
jgi:hypothetical protein